MKIYENQYHYGWEGDNGIGERLIQQIMDGTKTATCAPKISYTAEELEKTYALVGTVCTVTVDILPMPKSRGFQLSLVGFPASLRLAFSLAFQLSSGSYCFSTG